MSSFLISTGFGIITGEISSCLSFFDSSFYSFPNFWSAYDLLEAQSAIYAVVAILRGGLEMMILSFISSFWKTSKFYIIATPVRLGETTTSKSFSSSTVSLQSCFLCWDLGGIEPTPPAAPPILGIEFLKAWALKKEEELYDCYYLKIAG